MTVIENSIHIYTKKERKIILNQISKDIKTINRFIYNLRSSLSLRTCSQEVKELSNNSREPYRDILKKIDKEIIFFKEFCS